jgi:pilus assembly protein CpaB
MRALLIYPVATGGSMMVQNRFFRRFRRSGRLFHSPALFWFAAALIAVITARAVATQATETRTVHVIVVRSRSVPAGRALRGDDVAIRSVPQQLVPADASRSIREVIGRAATEPLVAGEIIRSARLGARHREGVARFLTTGRRAVAVPITEGALALHQRDHVDLLATLPAEVAGGAPESRLVASDALVVDVTEKRVTVSVTAAEAAMVATAIVSGSITLAQR